MKTFRIWLLHRCKYERTYIRCDTKSVVFGICDLATQIEMQNVAGHSAKRFQALSYWHKWALPRWMWLPFIRRNSVFSHVIQQSCISEYLPCSSPFIIQPDADQTGISWIRLAPFLVIEMWVITYDCNSIENNLSYDPNFQYLKGDKCLLPANASVEAGETCHCKHFFANQLYINEKKLR